MRLFSSSNIPKMCAVKKGGKSGGNGVFGGTERYIRGANRYINGTGLVRFGYKKLTSKEWAIGRLVRFVFSQREEYRKKISAISVVLCFENISQSHPVGP